MAEERKQFTFYRSFYLAAKRLKNKQQRCELYDAVCAFALDGTEPDMDKLPDAVAMALELVLPNLVSSRRKAESGSTGGRSKQTASKPQANSKQTASKKESASAYGESEKEKEEEKEIEGEKEIEIENECYIPPKSSPLGEPAEAKAPEPTFAAFWDQYPVKQNETDAMIAFLMAKQDQPKILAGLEKWLQSGVWRSKPVPSGAAFIRNRIWAREPEGGDGA